MNKPRFFEIPNPKGFNGFDFTDAYHRTIEVYFDNDGDETLFINCVDRNGDASNVIIPKEFIDEFFEKFEKIKEFRKGLAATRSE